MASSYVQSVAQPVGVLEVAQERLQAQWLVRTARADMLLAEGQTRRPHNLKCMPRIRVANDA